jgi:hypothetical protein
VKTPPDISGQKLVLFFTEGQNAAMLVSNKAGRRNVGGMKLATPEAALAWCRSQGATFVYLPSSPGRN